MKQYHRLETPKIYALVKAEVLDDDGNLSDGDLVDPSTSIQIIIADPTGKVVQELISMDHISTGKYSFSGYTIPSSALTGTYPYEIRAKEGIKGVSPGGAFEVIGEIA